MNFSHFLTSALSFVLFSAASLAQASTLAAMCQVPEGLSFSNAGSDAAATSVVADAASEPMNTGEASSSPGATTSLTDFAQRFAIALGGQQLGQDGTEDVTFEFSSPLAAVGFKHDNDYKVSMGFQNEELFPELREQLGEARAGDLAGKIDLADSFSLQFDYSPSFGRFGRNPQSKVNEWILSEMVTEAFVAATFPSPNTVDLQDCVEDELEKLMMSFGIGEDVAETFVDAVSNGESPDPRLAEQFAEEVSLLAQVQQAGLKLQQTSLDRFKENLQGSDFNHVVTLVRNQPQLVFSGSYHRRDELVGQNEWSVKASFEAGTRNLNAATRNCSNDKEKRAMCVQQYLNRRGMREDIGKGDRFAISVEYVRKKGYDFTDDASSQNLDIDGSKSIIAELTYGRYFLLGDGTDPKLRLDVGAKYEDVSDDEMRQDRATASAVLSRELAKDVFFTLGMVWANKPEFRAEADRDLTAKLGINYKLGGKQD